MTTRVIETVVTNDDKPPCRTAAQMTQLCCEKTAALQCCEEVVNAWPGYTAKEIIDHHGLVLDDQGRDKDGRYVNIQMQPRKKPCGEQVTKYDTSQKNCCEGVAALAWNMTVTPDVLPHGRSIIIAWTGSDGRKIEVTTTSNATSFDDGRKTAIGYGNSIELFAGPTFCGSTAVTVRDGCSSSTITIRSDLGQWVFVGYGCQLSGLAGDLTGSDENGQRIVQLIRGNIKQIDYQVSRSSFGGSYAGMSEYFGGLYHVDHDIPAVCPALNQAVCTPNENIFDQHCQCANLAGYPVVASPTCLAPNVEGIVTDHPCSAGVWLVRPGAISINCSGPGWNVEGGVWGYAMSWLEAGTPSKIYQWLC